MARAVRERMCRTLVAAEASRALMLRLNVLGCRRGVRVNEAARKPSDATATSTRGIFFLEAAQKKKVTERRARANPAFCHAVAAVAATQR